MRAKNRLFQWRNLSHSHHGKHSLPLAIAVLHIVHRPMGSRTRPEWGALCPIHEQGLFRIHTTTLLTVTMARQKGANTTHQWISTTCFWQSWVSRRHFHLQGRQQPVQADIHSISSTIVDEIILFLYMLHLHCFGQAISCYPFSNSMNSGYPHCS